MKTVDEYISELHNGNKIRITYNRMTDDCLGGGWTEELWSYNNSETDQQYICEYPISTYEKEFYTTHTLEHTKANMQEAIIDLNTSSNSSQYVVAIKIALESNEGFDLEKSLEEKYLEQMKQLKDESDHDAADCILCELLEELGFDKIVEVYRKLPKWYS